MKTCDSTPAPAGLTAIPNGVLMTVKVVPGSSRTETAGFHGRMLKVKVAAVPEKGKANKALVAFLAGKLNLKKAAVQIQSGQTSCIKQIILQGVTVGDVEALFRENP
ncbi:MAG: DUF167 domain-containing protein [Planctomycetales bacterium]|nr:DUF167 domain-containing protein [Planctomycetales bacterium]